MRIIGISDVSLGYGSPEIPALFDVICERAGAQGLLLEPDEPDRPRSGLASRRPFLVERISSVLPSTTTAWRREFLRAARLRIEREHPDTLVIFGGANFLLLPSLRQRPRTVIYHAYEQIADLGPDDLNAHAAYLPDVDLVISPEPRRLAHDCSLLGVWPRKVISILNSADNVEPGLVERQRASDRNGRFLWSGALHRKRTFADYLWSDQLSAFGIDIFGRISDPETEVVKSAIAGRPNLDWRGVRDGAELSAARARSAFSLVWWNPANSFGHLHLASNRFFSSIAAGVPPVCGPHPQCTTIARRYDCGIVLDDWSLDAVARGMTKAQSIFGGDRYGRLVENCVAAADADLGWPIQAEKVRSVLADKGGAVE
jgi:hypothetical protein